jgi:hypothetical protein
VKCNDLSLAVSLYSAILFCLQCIALIGGSVFLNIGDPSILGQSFVFFSLFLFVGLWSPVTCYLTKIIF